jgi:hypothetical protein
VYGESVCIYADAIRFTDLREVDSLSTSLLLCIGYALEKIKGKKTTKCIEETETLPSCGGVKF